MAHSNAGLYGSEPKLNLIKLIKIKRLYARWRTDCCYAMTIMESVLRVMFQVFLFKKLIF